MRAVTPELLQLISELVEADMEDLEVVREDGRPVALRFRWRGRPWTLVVVPVDDGRRGVR